MPTKKTKNTFEKELRQFVIKTLRRASLYWKPRNEAFSDARTCRGIYKCASCLGLFKRNQVQADHQEPVVSTKSSFVDFNTYINRLFIKKEGYSILCKTCHLSKSKTENMSRKK